MSGGEKMAGSVKPIYIDLQTVAAVVCLSTSSVQRLIREDRFPKPRTLSANRVAWLVREVEDWAEGRPVSDIPPPPNTAHSNRPHATSKAEQQQSPQDAQKFA